MLFIAAAVLLTGFQSGFSGGTTSAAAGETEKKSKGVAAVGYAEQSAGAGNGRGYCGYVY